MPDSDTVRGDCVRIRLAGPGDAEQLFALNERFNGRGETSPADIEKSLADNRREIVVVAEEGSALVGFVCVQIKKSFCYRAPSAEITEVFVEDRYRRKKLASGMIRFAEAYCGENYPLHRWELLTGADNRAAQALYASVGYESEGEIHLAKRL